MSKSGSTKTSRDRLSGKVTKSVQAGIYSCSVEPSFLKCHGLIEQYSSQYLNQRFGQSVMNSFSTNGSSKSQTYDNITVVMGRNDVAGKHKQETEYRGYWERQIPDERCGFRFFFSVHHCHL